jgi:hypothetical protein
MLAKHIREGTNWLEDGAHDVPLEDIRAFYDDLWGHEADVIIPFDSTPPLENQPERLAITAITSQEIKARITRLKTGTAPGPDGIAKKHILRPQVKEALRLLYNIMLVSGKQPSTWSKNRTVLIPKPGKDLAKIASYRPITISSLLCRIYWGVIDTRLRKQLSFSPRQKGFVHEAGCFNNINILNEILRDAKTKGGVTIAQLDISKAFDTVPHKAIDPALRRLGVSPAIRDSIVTSYHKVTTDIRHKGTELSIALKRGVKQRDPLSPLIFNAILDPLLGQLEELKGYSINDACNISSLAFADDLLLISDTREGAEQLLLHTERYLYSLGMHVAATKCTSFEIKTTKDSWYVVDPDLHLSDDTHIPSSTAGSTLTYLGGLISPWNGIQQKDLGTRLQATLHRLRSASLKPHQKLHLLSTFIIHHFLYATTLAILPMSIVRNMDSLIRTHVKDFLHLPASTPNGLSYASKRDGGLGIPKLEMLSTSTTLKQGLTLLKTQEESIIALLQNKGYEGRLEPLAKSARIPWPINNLRQIEAFKKSQKKLQLREWGALLSKGKSVPDFENDRYGNAWLYDPTLLKPSRFLTALRMRSCTTSDRVCLNTAIPQATIKCRKCKTCNETLAHVLGQCLYTKTQRIHRHDEIRNFISKKLVTTSQNFEVIEEAAITTPSGTLKPDLVAINRGRVLVIDITVRHEDTGYLDEGRSSKIQKYTPLLPLLADQLKVKPGEVLPIVVGTRGAIPKATIASLQALDIIDKGSYTTLALLALRNSIEIYCNFMEYNASR